MLPSAIISLAGGLGAGIKLIEPEEVVKQMQDRVCELYREYVEE